MRRTNIYLDDDDLSALRSIGSLQSRPVAELVREAVADWLSRHGVERIAEDDWQQRLGQLLDRREEVEASAAWEPDEVENDVATALAEVRRARSAGRR